jgi:hypothetical protein
MRFVSTNRLLGTTKAIVEDHLGRNFYVFCSEDSFGRNGQPNACKLLLNIYQQRVYN